MGISKIIGERLQNERLRLRYSQGQISDLAKENDVAGATQNQISRWERGDQAVNVEFLSVLAEIGFDVCYIITGRRSLDYSEMVIKDVLGRLDMPDLPSDMKTPEALLLGMRFQQRNFKPLNDDGTPFVLGMDTTMQLEKRRGRPKGVSMNENKISKVSGQVATNSKNVVQIGGSVVNTTSKDIGSKTRKDE